VEPTTPCVTNTPERTPTFRQPNFSGRKTTGHASNQGASTGGASSGSNNQLSTRAEVVVQHSSKWQDMIPRSDYHNFEGEASEDPEKHLFICEKIWEEKKITDEDTNLMHS
jgi:hypothetical protein